MIVLFLEHSLATWHDLRIGHQRYPHFGPVAHQAGAVKIAWRNSNDDEGIAVDKQLAPDCVWVTSKAALPAVVAEHHDRIGTAAAIVILLKQPAEHRLHTQNAEVVFADDVRPEKFGARANCDA